MCYEYNTLNDLFKDWNVSPLSLNLWSAVNHETCGKNVGVLWKEMWSSLLLSDVCDIIKIKMSI